MKFIPSAVTARFGTQLLKLQKSSPKLMFAAGITAGVASTFLACRATLKVSGVLETGERRKQTAHDLFADKSVDYAEKTYHRDLTKLKVITTFNLCKLYAPSFLLASASVALLTGSHVTLTRRNASLTAAYASVDQAFKRYRERVRAELGPDGDEDLDLHFRYGSQNVEETVVGKDGKTKTVQKKRVDPNGASQYARFFDEYSPNWRRSAESNAIFLMAQQKFANDRLQSQGFLFLNEVYEALGMPRSPEGQIVGWIADTTKGGDGYVDFGIWNDAAKDGVREFLFNGEYSVMIDFNVDGVVYDKI